MFYHLHAHIPCFATLYIRAVTKSLFVNLVFFYVTHFPIPAEDEDPLNKNVQCTDLITKNVKDLEMFSYRHQSFKMININGSLSVCNFLLNSLLAHDSTHANQLVGLAVIYSAVKLGQDSWGNHPGS